MRTRTLLLSLLTALLVAGLSTPASAQAQARTLSETVALDPNGSVFVDNHEGRITVTGWDCDAVQYEVVIDAPGGSDELENTEIRVTRWSRSLRFETEYRRSGPLSWNRNVPPVHYTIRMPRTARLSIDDHDSNIEVTGLASDLEIDTHDGPIRVADHEGRVTIDSHDGRMELQNVTGDLAIDTHDGDVTVTNLRGGFELDTHDGTADVTFAALTGDVEIDTHDGRFTLTLPAGTGFDLHTDFDDDANLDADFDLSGIRLADDEDDEVNYRGAVNGGGPRIELSAHDGRFALRTR